MNKLFYVTLYSHLENNYVRIALTAKDGTEAKVNALEAVSEDYKVRSCEFICSTPDDDIFTEL